MKCKEYDSEYQNTIDTLKECLKDDKPKLEKVAIDLKNCLSKMNNIITARLSYKFLEYLKGIKVLNPGDYDRAIKLLGDSDTNSNGYDIHIDGNFPILAEIKSTLPCDNNGTTYGPAQQTEILEDIRRLALEEEKKKELKNESLNNYYRFQVLLESPDTRNTQVAIENLMNTKKASGLRNHCYYLEKKDDLNKDRIGILCISL